MNNNRHLKRSQKVALLTSFMEGNAAPVAQYKQEQEKPFAYVLECCQLLPIGRSVTDKRPDDLITGIKLIRSYRAGRPNETDQLPDMVRVDFELWYAELRSQGCPVVGMMGIREIEQAEIP